MRIPSRRMRSRPPLALWRKLCLAALVLGLCIVVLISHIFAACVALCALLVALPGGKVGLNDREHRRQLAASRTKDSICTFARSFDRRQVDPWAIRGVYDVLQEFLDSGGLCFPIRAGDDLEVDLRFDQDDLDMDLGPAIAERIGRPLDAMERNPYHGKVRTVGDLVMFFNLQPHKQAVGR